MPPSYAERHLKFMKAQSLLYVFIAALSACVGSVEIRPTAPPIRNLSCSVRSDLSPLNQSFDVCLKQAPRTMLTRIDEANYDEQTKGYLKCRIASITKQFHGKATCKGLSKELELLLRARKHEDRLEDLEARALYLKLYKIY